MASIVVTGRDMQVSARNREHAEDKISKLSRYFDRIGKIEAILAHAGDAASAELVISVGRGKTIVCHSMAKDLYAAIDLVVDKAEIQLTKFKEKLKEHHKGDKAPPGAAAGEGRSDEEGLESYDDVIEKRDF